MAAYLPWMAVAGRWEPVTTGQQASRKAWSERVFVLVKRGAPGRIRTCATASGGRCSIP